MADRRADTVRRRREQNALSEPTFVIRIKVWHFRTNDDGDADGRRCQVPGDRTFDSGQPLQHLAVAHDHELPWLAIPCAPGPAGNLENVVQYRLRQRLRAKLAHRAQAAEEPDPRGLCVRFSMGRHRGADSVF